MANLIYKQMNLVMKDVGAIGKDQNNAQQGFKFRGIDQFVNALYPALTKHGVFMTPECTSYTQELRDVVRSSGKSGVDKHIAMQMKYHFYAEDGSSVSVGPIPAEGLDSGDKATNKALSAALKYALIQTFSIPTVDMVDGDSESPTIERKGFTATVTNASPSTVAVTNGTTSARVDVSIGSPQSAGITLTTAASAAPSTTTAVTSPSSVTTTTSTAVASETPKARTTFRSVKPKADATSNNGWGN